MKCPVCEEEAETQIYCEDCGEVFEVALIDPAELLRSIEKVDDPHMLGKRIPLTLIDCVYLALKGDPGPLKKLAGVE